MERLIIVRRGATELFEALRARFAGDPATRILWDRREGDEARSGVTPAGPAGPPGDRRGPQDPRILATRGFFATRSKQGRTVARDRGMEGETDITSGMKEGRKEGDLADALSFTIPVN